jgi:hypothetical protein
MRRTALRVLVAAGLAALASSASATTMLRSLSLAEVTAEATRIVHAYVVDVRSGRDESGAPATWVTLEVARAVKGSAGPSLTFKQFGADRLPDGALGVVAGVPRYRAGEEIVLFLRGDSARGFTSPVGLGQGVYRVSADGGQRVVRRDLPAESQDLEGFLASVAKLAAASR